MNLRLLATLLLLGCARLASAADLYYLTHEIPIGGEGGWDYLSLDAAARRLYVTHATKVVVIDVDREGILGQITGTPGVHGFALAPELKRGFASNGREGTVSIVDLLTLKTISKTTAGENPDAIIYEAGRQEVYAFNGRSPSVTVIAAATGVVVTNTPLPGKPEFAAADAFTGRVYCNIEDKNEVVVLDAKTHAVVQVWPITPGEEASGMAIDPATHHLFIGCHNERMLMLNAATGGLLDKVAIGQGVDACAFDPGTQLAFSSCGDGTTTIARELGGKLEVVQTLWTRRGARTMALDPQTHKIYLATVDYEAQPDDQTRRPRQIPNTLKVLVYSMAKSAP
ncbi:MAG TPA: YncE family protein [Verrucomicrobiae bacterium]|jgi:DNA-binding beta-propeller fold protein YncE|nr:YncE family protein [Verrucomicrobiae bacterium]